MQDEIRDEVFEINGVEKGWSGYVLDKSTETQLIQKCLFTFVNWALKNKQYDFDHVQIVTKYDTIGIKWHVRMPKPNPSK